MNQGIPWLVYDRLTTKFIRGTMAALRSWLLTSGKPLVMQGMSGNPNIP